MPIHPALAVLEFDSIAAGIEAGDAMVKRAPIQVLRSGTIHPGKYIVLVEGSVGDVEEAFDAGRAVGGLCLLATLLLPNVHPQVVAALEGVRQVGAGEALGIVETETVTATINAADAGLKGANVRLLDLRLGDGLGGKGYLLFDGSVSEVESAVEIATDRLVEVDGWARAPITRIISKLHREMRQELEADPRFRSRMRDVVSGPPPHPRPPRPTRRSRAG